MIKLTLDMPPTGNHRLTISKSNRRLIKAPAYRAWMDAAAWQIKAQLATLGIKEPIATKSFSVLNVVAPDLRKRDYDNVAKCINDALQKGGAITDDALIKCAFSYSTLDRVNGGVVNIFLGQFTTEDISQANSMINQALLFEQKGLKND